MKKSRLIFYCLFALFHLGAFIFTVVLDYNSNLLFKMVSWVHSFKWITLFGLALFVIDFLWVRAAKKESDAEKSEINREMNILKAKLFDLQEGAKSTAQSNPPKV
jgi:hypothetical protein